MNVLVVEDERNLADAIVKILEDEGYNAEATYDGKAGLTCAKSGLYDAIVLDVMLPGMSGYDVVNKMRTPACPRPSSCSPRAPPQKTRYAASTPAPTTT